MQPLPRVQPGQTLTADLLNAVIAAAERGGAEIRAGDGINVGSSPDGTVTVSLAKLIGEHVRMARIINRTGQAIDRADAIRYDVQELGTGNIVTGMEPYWGRPTKRGDVEIEAAVIGSMCWLVREPVGGNVRRARLWIPSGGISGETLAFAECGANEGPLVGAVMTLPSGDGGTREPNGGGGGGTGKFKGGGFTLTNPVTES